MRLPLIGLVLLFGVGCCHHCLCYRKGYEASSRKCYCSQGGHCASCGGAVSPAPPPLVPAPPGPLPPAGQVVPPAGAPVPSHAAPGSASPQPPASPTSATLPGPLPPGPEATPLQPAPVHFLPAPQEPVGAVRPIGLNGAESSPEQLRLRVERLEAVVSRLSQSQ